MKSMRTNPILSPVLSDMLKHREWTVLASPHPAWRGHSQRLGQWETRGPGRTQAGAAVHSDRGHPENSRYRSLEGVSKASSSVVTVTQPILRVQWSRYTWHSYF